MQKENILLISSIAICITLLLGIYDSWKVDIVLGLAIVNLVTAFLMRQEYRSKKLQVSSSTVSSAEVSKNTHTPIDTHTPAPVTAPTPSPLSFSPSPVHENTSARKPRRKKNIVAEAL